MKNKSINVDYMSRVEGEGALHVDIRDGNVEDVKLNIFEPPRYFEALLRGRDYTEAPDITARICGICPVAYQMSSCHAMEDIMGVKVEGQLRELRRLLYCGEWIESHALHVFMLHAPDFLGYEDAISMAADYPDQVGMGLKLKKIGNELMSIMGGRSVHPINPRVGGFYKVPDKKQLTDMVDRLEWARDASLQTVRWVAQLNFPDFEPDYEFVALRHPDEYPLNEGNVVSSKGIDIPLSQYENNFIEEHVAHSTALHSRKKDGGIYLVGPIARYNLNFDKLPSSVQQAAREAGLSNKCNNPYKGIIIRSLETLYACEESLRIIDQYQKPEKPYVKMKPRAGRGFGCTEAPRGILYHRYDVDEEGKILDAKIVPPTSQNQKMIESDLRDYVSNHVDMEEDKLQWQCEQIVRNYDPCISCSTHFLDLRINRKSNGRDLQN